MGGVCEQITADLGRFNVEDAQVECALHSCATDLVQQAIKRLTPRASSRQKFLAKEKCSADCSHLLALGAGLGHTNLGRRIEANAERNMLILLQRWSLRSTVFGMQRNQQRLLTPANICLQGHSTTLAYDGCFF